MVFLSCADSIFYAISQYRIVTTMSRVHNAPVSVAHIVVPVLRSACYISAVLLNFLTIGQYFFPMFSGVFIFQTPNIMILVLLSDITRIRDVTEYYNSQGRNEKLSKLSAFKSDATAS
ncbi:hypothetical protein DFJ73DRAFT_846300 [Zopfochytrium polystomum]|nr:hypothetical protein DFJ73DRAFT_846300 [Zopfochytrium polystomum]